MQAIKAMAKANRERGEKSEEELLRIIKEKPGLSFYELTKEMGWSNGKTSGCLKRLIQKNRIKMVRSIRKQGIGNFIFPKDFEFETDTIGIPSELLKANPPWKEIAYLYALSANSFGISGQPVPNWEKMSKFTDTAKIINSNGTIEVTPPKDFADFYKLCKSLHSTAILNDKIIVTVEGFIL